MCRSFHTPGYQGRKSYGVLSKRCPRDAVFGGLILVRNLPDLIRAITEQAERISSADINERLAADA